MPSMLSDLQGLQGLGEDVVRLPGSWMFLVRSEDGSKRCFDRRRSFVF